MSVDISICNMRRKDKLNFGAWLPVIEKQFHCQALRLPSHLVMDLVLMRFRQPIAIGLLMECKPIGDIRIEDYEQETFERWGHLIREDGKELRQLIFVTDEVELYWAEFGSVVEGILPDSAFHRIYQTSRRVYAS